MVVLSFKVSEVLNLAIAINEMSAVKVGIQALPYYHILIKIKKSLKNRINKAHVQNIIDAFVIVHNLKITTYKKGGK